MPATRLATEPTRDVTARKVAARPPFYHLTGLWISLTRCMIEVAEPKATQQGDWSVRDHLICGTIYLGTIEKRSMTAINIAADLGIPRSTVFRHLALLEQHGLIKRAGDTWSTAADLMTDRRKKNFGVFVSRVQSTAKRLAEGQHEKRIP